MDSFKTYFIGIFSIGSIEWIQSLENLPSILKYSGQTIIGILSIIFLIKKIQIMNDLRKNKDNEKNITIS